MARSLRARPGIFARRARRITATVLAVLLHTSLLTAVQVATSPAAQAATPACSATMNAQYANVDNTAGYTATPSHGQVFYIDSGVSPKVDASYVGYTIKNNTGSTKTFWVSLDGFTGQRVSLASPADEFQQVTNLASGSSATVFYLLKASVSTTVAQTHTVKVWDKRPDLSGAATQMSCNFTFLKVAETIKAKANKIGTVTSSLSPATATLGGTYTVTIANSASTKTGTLGNGSSPDFAAFWASPSAYSSWPTQALRLEETSITIACTGSYSNIVLTNKLFVSDVTAPTATTLANCIANGGGSQWYATYKFRIIGAGPASLTPSPIANISSGTQYKHSDLSGISATSVDLSGVSAASAMRVAITGAVDRTTFGAPATGFERIKYTVKVTTSSTSDLLVDEIVDKHDQNNSSVAYVPNSTTNQKYNSNTAIGSATSGPEPNVLAADTGSPKPQHFVGPFTGISSTSSRWLNYYFDIPCDGLPHTNTIFAYVGDVAIAYDSTSADSITATFAPTTCSASITNGKVSLAPTANTVAATDVTDLTATLNGLTNSSGNTGTSYRFVYDTDGNFPAVTASSPAWTAISGSPATNTERSLAVSRLTALTSYYFKVQIKDSNGNIFEGARMSFTTVAQKATPTVTTNAASVIGTTAATLNGSINPNGIEITNVYFTYSKSNSVNATTGILNASSPNAPVDYVVRQDDGSNTPPALTFAANSFGGVSVNSDDVTDSSQLTFSSNTIYYFQIRIVCVTTGSYCPLGYVVGSVLQFKTGTPTADTTPVSLVADTTARINGSVKAPTGAGGDTTIAFCYSNSSTMSTVTIGRLATCLNTGPNAAFNASVTAGNTQSTYLDISGLAHGSFYYFQILGTASGATTYGTVLSFQTLDISTTTTLARGTLSTTYTAFTFAGVGGTGTYTWSKVSGTIPSGMTLAATGLFSGSPGATGTFSFTVRMTDEGSTKYTEETFTITIDGAAPTVTTVDATSVTTTSATLSGSVVPNGSTISASAFCWGTNPGLTSCTSESVSVSGWSTSSTNNATASLTGLNPNTTYYFKLGADWSGGTSFSSPILNFTTLASPTVSTVSATDVRTKIATINGTISPNGNTITKAEFCWGTDNTLVTCATQTISRTGWTTSGTYNATADLPDLTPNTTYYYKVSAYWSGGSVSTTPANFKTGLVSTSNASSVGVNGATIAGTYTVGSTAIANNTVTTVQLCYSTSSSTDADGLLNSGTSCTSNFWSGTSTLSASGLGSYSRTLSGLDSQATYNFQQQVIFANGEKAHGDVKTFTTLNLPGTSLDNALRITGKTAQIRGKVNPRNNSMKQVTMCLSTDINVSASSCGTASDLGTSFIVNSNADNATDQVLRNLSPLTTYYVLLFAKTNNFVSAASVFKASALRIASMSTAFNKAWGTGTTSKVKTAVAPTSDTVYSSTTSFTTAGAVTNNATTVTSSRATLNGTLTASSSGLANTDVKSVKLCYSTANTLTNGVLDTSPVCSGDLWASSILNNAEAKSFSYDVTSGLIAGRNYYEQLQVVFWDDSTLNGAAVLFATPNLQTATTSAADSLSSTGATLHGTVNANGSTLTSVKFCYDTTSSFTNGCDSSHTVTLSGPVGGGGWNTASNIIATTLTGLTSSTRYYYKILTVSNAGTVESSYTDFTTLSVLSFSVGSGSSVQSIEFTAGGVVSLSSSTTTWDGHTFQGWFEASTGGTAVSTLYAPGNTDKVLYAQWTITQYDVIYDEGGGSSVSNAKYSTGGTINDPGATTRTGYRFEGWYDAGSGGNKYTFPFTATGLSGTLNIYAQWTKVTYNVTFDERGGTDTNDQTYQINGYVSSPSPASTRAGYKFEGWYTDPTGGSKITFSSYPAAGTATDIALYAHWTAYVVTFSVGRGGGTPPGATSGVIRLPGQGSMTAPVNSTFGGWQCPEPGPTLAENALFEPTANVMCTAVWVTNGSVTVTFHKNFASSTDTSTQSTNTTTTLSRNSFVVTGYHFAYWCKTNASSCATVSDRVADEASYAFDANLDLYAIWVKNTYTITFSSNYVGGAAASTVSKDFDYVMDSAELAGHSASRTGYTLSGWSQGPSGSTMSTYRVTQDETLYAIWTINSYVITYNRNYGTATSKTNSYDYGEPDALNFDGGWSQTGYDFGGWSASTTGTALSTYTVTRTDNLYAVWNPVTYTITYDKNDGTATPSTASRGFLFGATGALSYSTGFTRTGYTLGGWASTGRTGDTLTSYTVDRAATLYAKWVPGDNTVIFDPSNGAATSSSTYRTGGTIANPNWTPTYAGKHFNGWFEASTGGGVITFPYAPGGTGTVTLYAQWTSYVVTFALGSGGSTPAAGTKPADMSGLIAHLPGQGLMVAPTSYYFGGWTCTGSPTVLPANAAIEPTGDTTCTAEWILNTAKVITFHSNYPAGTNTTTTQSGSSSASLNPNPFIAGGYSFGGWSTTTTGVIRFVDRDTYDFLLDGDLYAQWNLVSSGGGTAPYVIKFDYQGGDGSIAVTYYTIGAPGINLPDPTKLGYTFAGWTRELTQTNAVPEPFTTDKDVELHAQWVPNRVTVRFNYMGGIRGILSKTYQVGSLGITLPTSTKGSYLFTGWSETQGGEAPVIEPYAPLTNTTLYAIWNGTQYKVKLDPIYAPSIILTYTVGGDPLELPALENHEELTFNGWNNKTNTFNTVPNKYRPTKSLTLYPVWSELDAETAVFFSGDSAKITKSAKKILNALAKSVYASPQHRQLVVNGWVKETLNKSYDHELSDNRAVNTAKYLKSLGVDAFASTYPKGISPENSSVSRRSNISVFYSGPKKK